MGVLILDSTSKNKDAAFQVLPEIKITGPTFCVEGKRHTHNALYTSS